MFLNKPRDRLMKEQQVDALIGSTRKCLLLWCLSQNFIVTLRAQLFAITTADQLDRPF
jgi:hypothetical protein